MKKRLIATSLVITLFFTGLTGRIGFIIFSKDNQVAKSNNSYSLTIDTTQPTIYYRNGSKATNNEKSYVAVIRPNPKSIGELNKLFNIKQRNEIIEELMKGYPILIDLDRKPNVELKHIKIFYKYSTTNSLYQVLDKKSNGLFNRIDTNIGSKKISFSLDATGRLLDGDSGTVEEINYNSPEGYTLSIDKDVQEIVINACKNMNKGCALVMNINDNSILACVNKPYENYNIKAFCQYSVGSVFKLVVSACALENNVDLVYNCIGSITVNDVVFSCQSNHKHGTQNLKNALANSCNCYFVNLVNELGRKKLLEVADKLGFNDNTELFDSWIIKNATLPTDNELLSKGELSLFGFGQGKLLCTPLQIASMLSTISNKGFYQQPKLVLSNINNNGIRTNIVYKQKEKALSEETCNKLLEYMRYVVTNGTGTSAETGSHKSAGKTATAQTGQYCDGMEYLNTWFVGVYPYDNPKYAIVIMNEQGTSGAKDCCPIFRTIVEQIENL